MSYPNAPLSAAESLADRGNNDVATDFAGTRTPLFKIAFKAGVLTVLTLGFYRFWMKTKLRRYYWSSIRPGGVPLEYMGQPIEKLLGFLIAVVFLAFYIGIVNLILMFASFAIFHGNVTAYVLSFIGVLPLLFYARYRARRYLLARTRWRGIRFGLEPGAWGYALRALFYWLLTICSLGLLWPLMTFQLEKYVTDRTYYGSLTLHQGGSFWALFRPFLHMLIPWLVTLAVVFAVVLSLPDLSRVEGMRDLMTKLFEDEIDLDIALRLAPLLVITIPWLLIGRLHYAVQSFRIMANLKQAGDLRFQAAPRTGRMLWIYCSGYTVTYLTLVVGLGVLLIVAAIALLPMLGGAEVFGDVLLQGSQQVVPQAVALGVSIASYFAIFVLWGVFEHIFVVLPRIRHYAETLKLIGDAGLPAVAQRARDEFSEAEGFAEALDLGAAI